MSCKQEEQRVQILSIFWKKYNLDAVSWKCI